MQRPNKAEMNLTGLLRVLFRWKRAGGAAFGILLAASVLTALFKPLKYESQVILEHKPIRITPQIDKQQDNEFDVYRLTSESQSSVALMKSRYMMERWLGAVGLRPANARDKEQALKRLYHSLTVEPISYTDLFIVKVRARSPEEAARRAGLLSAAFAQWDEEQNRQEAQNLTTLLQSRAEQVNRQLGDQWARLKRQKGSQLLSLSGISGAKQLELSIDSQSKLYDILTVELEEAERLLHSDLSPRVRVVAPPSIPGEPVLSRAQLFLLGGSASVLAALALIFLLEWLDPSIRRSQDIIREIPSGSVLAIPPLESSRFIRESTVYLGPLSEAIAEMVQARGSAVVQFASPSEGDGKTAISTSLAQMLSSNFKICLIRRVGAKAPASHSPTVTSGDYKVLDVDRAEPLARHLEALKQNYNLVLIDTDNGLPSLPGSGLVPEAEMACVLVSAGRTSRHAFGAFRQQLQRLPDQRLVFILNRYEDPLPRWLQSR